MKRLAIPDCREISSIEVPSHPAFRNKRIAVFSSARWRRSASFCVGRPPGPRLKRRRSRGWSGICNAITFLLWTHVGDKCNDTMSLHKIKGVNARLLLVGAIVAISGLGWWWWESRAAPPLAWQGYAEADFVK